MENYNGIGNEIIEGGIFERFPELKPQGGENYWQGEHFKLLLVGESNYFGDDLESESNFKVAEKWYKGDRNRLIPEKKISDVGNWVSGNRFDNIFISMKNVLDEKGVSYFKDDLLQEAIYYNYFLRPAREYNKKGERDLGFKKDCEKIDCEVSYSALCGIIKEKEPNIVIFVSKFAWEKFMKFYEKQFENVVIDFVYHFSSPRTWKHRSGNGKQKFEDLLWKYWIRPIDPIIKEQTLQLFNYFQANPFWNKDIWGEIFWYDDKDGTCAYFDNISKNISIDIFCAENDKYQFQIFERENPKTPKPSGVEWIKSITNLTTKGSRYESRLQSRQEIMEVLENLMK
ncbi:MAG: hypothetical protein WCK78_10150 [Paludibacter sp.]